MNIEQYDIVVTCDGTRQVYPVMIASNGSYFNIKVEIDGRNVCFIPDNNNVLRPAIPLMDMDPELLYQIGRAIRSQRPYATA